MSTGILPFTREVLKAYHVCLSDCQPGAMYEWVDRSTGLEAELGVQAPTNINETWPMGHVLGSDMAVSEPRQDTFAAILCIPSELHSVQSITGSLLV